ncbi:MAG: redoxin domain-containing protein [Planctomycetes bacterium]|nr:redoxin domain-containing protein [Planctomycetota bacterium]
MSRCARMVLACLIALALPLAAQAQDETRAKTPIGHKISAFKLKDYLGKTWALDDFKDSKLMVVAFLGNECPLAQFYATRLGEYEVKLKEKGVALIAINSNQQDSLAEMAHYAKKHKIEFPLLKDPGNVVADDFHADRTPEVFVLDSKRVIRYWGRIDDQFRIGSIQRAKVSSHDMMDAVEELLAGKKVSTPVTECDGCHIGRVFKKQNLNSDITYSKQISRILQKSCVECHREGEIAPFTLTKYDDVVGWAEMIDEVVHEQRMPPWSASGKYGKFANDPRLSADEKKLIHRWVLAGAPQGDPKDLPEPREFVKGWRIGKPDDIIYMRDKPFSVKARGEVRYQYFVVDPGWKEDKWIKAAECRPGNRKVVHHIIVAVAGKRFGRFKAHGVTSDWITAMAPGSSPLILDDGFAKFVPAGSKLLFQLHYTPIGTPQTDRSSVGFIFADPKSVKKVVGTRAAVNNRFVIPAGANNYRVNSSFTFREDTLLLALFPHMHLRGKSFRYTAVYPDKSEEILLDVPRYDFNWQIGLKLIEPKVMPAGTTLRCVAHFDNSEDNLANPDPTKTVRWGDQTWDEMMIGYFDMALVDQDLTKQAGKKKTPK